MDQILPNKSSSRAGRFKKKLVSQEELLTEAPLIEAKMAPFIDLYQSRQLSAAELSALFILTVLSYRSPGTWLGAKRPRHEISHRLSFPLSRLEFEPNIRKRLRGLNNIGDVFAHFALKSTPETVNRALLSWSEGSYGLELMFRIPTPEEVLHQQKQGRRVVTVLTDQRRTKNFILGERDSLSFTMHDLIHADHFYHNNDCYKGQLGFYGLLDFCMGQNHFEDYMGNEKFQAEFEYLIADMNAYAIHLLKCLKSALVHFQKDNNDFFKEWTLKIDATASERDALLALNTQDYRPSQDEILLSYLNRWIHSSFKG